jgi:hypothetical protein
MKIVELVNKVRISITNEELDILGKFNESAEVQKQDLNPREIVLANHLVNKDVLYRKNDEGRIYYKKKIRD